MHEHVTLLRPDARDQTPRGISSGFPVDLLSQSAGRLRVLALLYAFVYFMAGIFPALLFAEDRARFLGSFLQWGPSVLAIGVALLVAAVIGSPRLPLPAAMNIGLAFEIVSSYGIAAGEFADPMGLEMHGGGHMGLSGVAVWVVLFTVVVPTAPRRALLAALASVSSVPVVIGVIMVSGAISLRLDPGQFFFGLIFPYLLVVGMAYVGARVVYDLGTEVKRARAGELLPGGKARRGRDGRGVASAPSDAGTARRHQAHSSIRCRGRAPRGVHGGAPPIRARSPGDRAPPVTPYGGALRFRNRRGRRVLLRDGAARRPRRRLAPAALRAHPARAGHLPPAAGVSLAVGGPVLWPGASRHQAREHLRLPLRRRIRLRKGAGFRDRANGPRCRGDEHGAHAGERRSWNAGVHGPRAGDGDRGGRPRGYLRDRLRGLLAPDRAARVHRGHADGDARATRPGHAHTAISPGGPADPQATRGPHPRLSGEGPRGSTAVRQRAVVPTGRDRWRELLDPGPGPG